MQTNSKQGFPRGEVADAVASTSIWSQCVATEDTWIWAVCRRRHGWGFLEGLRGGFVGAKRGWYCMVEALKRKNTSVKFI